jgi:hypothetical protein
VSLAEKLIVYKSRRISCIRFERAVDGDPDAGKPDIDARGFRSPEFAAVLGMMTGKKVIIIARRQLISDKATLVAISDDEKTLKVVSPKAGVLATDSVMPIELAALADTKATGAGLQIRFGSAKGPIIAKLVVHCFSRFRIKIAPHIVTVKRKDGSQEKSKAVISDLLKGANAIWQPCGIAFEAAKTEEFTVAEADSQKCDFSTLDSLFGNKWIADHINIYFLPNGLEHVAGKDDPPGTKKGYFLGASINSNNLGVFGRPLKQTGIFVADKDPNNPADKVRSANDLAHELGHFMGLFHMNRWESDSAKPYFWDRRSLMYPLNPLPETQDYRDSFQGYGQTKDQARRGSFLSIKTILGTSTSPDCPTARTNAKTIATLISAGAPSPKRATDVKDLLGGLKLE